MVRHPISRDITVNFSPSVISDCDIASKSGAGDAGGGVLRLKSLGMDSFKVMSSRDLIDVIS